MRSFASCLQQAQSIGPNTTAVVQELLADKVIDRSKAAAGLIRLTERHSPELLELACQRAIELGDITSLTVRNMIEVCKKNAPSTAQLNGVNGLHSIGSNGHSLTATTTVPMPTFARSAQELCHEL